MAQSQLLASLWTKIGDIVAGFFAIIPQAMYFLYTSLASIIDLCQFIFRKLAGLETYYYNDNIKSGDILIDFIEGVLGINKQYSALNTVFWSLIIFGVIVLILMTILTLIKAQYNYDSEKSSPSYIIRKSVKAIFTMALVPLCTLFGLYLSQAMFKALDSITFNNVESQINEVFETDAINNFSYSTSENGSKIYSSYDFFNEREWCTNFTFSGYLFEICSEDANRVRYGSYTPNSENWDNMGVFYTNVADTTQAREIVADQIDFAFKNNLTLKIKDTVSISGDEAAAAIGSSLAYGPSAGFAAGLINVNSFSKYNVGLVWSYYNLWAFNFLLAFIGVAACISLFSSLLFGLFTRILFSVVLFMVYSPIVGIMPFDDGNSYKEWQKQFISYLLSAYTSVFAVNILFILLPAFFSISFFNINFLDGIVRMLIMIAGLTMAKRFVAIFSNFLGAQNIDELGQATKKSAGAPTMKAVGMTARLGGAALFSRNVANLVKTKTAPYVAKVAQKIGETKFAQKVVKSKAGRKIAQVSSQIGLTLTNASQKINNFGKKVKNVTKRVAKNPVIKSIGKIAASVIGLPVDPHRDDEYEDWTNPETGETEQVLKQTDEERKRGELRVRKPKMRTLLKNQLLDVSGASFKAIGNLLGLKDAFDKLYKSNDGVDYLKTQINSLASQIKGLKGPVFQTAKDTKLKETEKEDLQRQFAYDIDYSSSKKALEKIQEIAKQISGHPDDYDI